MRQPARPTAMFLTILLLGSLAACGSGKQEERKVIKPEDTVFGDLVTAPDKVQQRTDAAIDVHRDALEQKLRESEGSPPRE